MQLKTENLQIKKDLDDANDLNRRLQQKFLQSPEKKNEANNVGFEQIAGSSSSLYILRNSMEPKEDNVN